MHITACALIIIVLAATAAPAQNSAPAQTAKPPMSDAAYEKTMKEIASTFRSLQINNKVMNHADGEREARRLAAWFRDVQRYWEAKRVDDAMAFARTAVTAAEDIEKSSTAMDMTVLASAEKAMAGACQGCHMAHREQMPDGSFRMK